MAKFEYRYQDITFDNCWQAKKFEIENNLFVSFITDLTPYKQALEDKHINETVNYDLEYLKKLRKSKKYIRLFYSGGSDSHSILATAIDNKIFIDEIVVITRNLYNKPKLQECDTEIIVDAIPVLNNLDKSQVGKITFKNYDANFMRKIYSDENWIFNLPGGDFSFRMVQPFDYHNDHQSDCQIFGKEKPYILFYKNKWFATIFDTILTDVLMAKNSCFFYIEPENIKSFIIKARKLRNFISTNSAVIPGKIYSSYTSLKNQQLAGTSALGKYDNKLLNQKDILALAECVAHNDVDLIIKWSAGIKKLLEIFPDQQNGDYNISRTPVSKFPWFVDIDSLEIFSQQELIPDGFV